MPVVQLKTGEMIQVPIEKLENFLLKNKEAVQVRQVPRRGGKRSGVVLKMDFSDNVR